MSDVRAIHEGLRAQMRQGARGQREGFGGPRAPAVPAAMRPVNLHEMMKREVFGYDGETAANRPGDAPATPGHFEVQRANPAHPTGISDHYIVLDSFEKLESSRPERGEFDFNFMVAGTTRDQALGVTREIETVCALQIAPFTTPKLPYDNFVDSDLVALDFAAARQSLAEASRTARAAGDVWSEHAAAVRGVYADLLDGRVEGLRDRVDALLPRAAATGLRFFLETQAPLRCWLDIAEGRVAAGFDHLAAIPRLDAWPALPDAAWLMEGIGRALESRGNTRAGDFFDLAAFYWTRCGNADAANRLRVRAEEAR